MERPDASVRRCLSDFQKKLEAQRLRWHENGRPVLISLATDDISSKISAIFDTFSINSTLYEQLLNQNNKWSCDFGNSTILPGLVVQPRNIRFETNLDFERHASLVVQCPLIPASRLLTIRVGSPKDQFTIKYENIPVCPTILSQGSTF